MHLFIRYGVNMRNLSSMLCPIYTRNYIPDMNFLRLLPYYANQKVFSIKKNIHRKYRISAKYFRMFEKKSEKKQTG